MSRPQTATDEVAEKYVKELGDLLPSLAEVTGKPLPQHTWEDFSAAGAEAVAQLNRDTLAQLDKLPPQDSIDEVTQAAMHHRLGTDLALYEAGLEVGTVANIASPLQQIRDGFTLLPTQTLAQWEDMVRRLEQVPTAIASYRSGVQSALEADRRPTAVAVAAALKDLQQQRTQTDPYARVVKQLKEAAAGEDALARELKNSDLLSRAGAAATAAMEATTDLAGFFASEVQPHASNEDAVGAQALSLYHESFLGAGVEPEETYQWALERLRQIHRDQKQLANQIYGDVGVQEAMERLNEEPAYQLHGTEALLKWMQATADEAVDNLAQSHFTVPDQIRQIECCISPAGDGGIFYTAPADDYSRPGRMWWAVPPGQELFHTWQEKTTVYHEGMPGHHMQLGIAVTRKEEMNSWRRLLCWYSGHGEGWALYAEALMEELGYLSDPADRLGLLDAQRLRAARVVVDLGVHTGMKLPSASYLADIGIDEEAWRRQLDSSPYVALGDTAVAEGVWDRNAVWAFMANNVAMDPSFLAFETTRYLTWPGQASSYAVGQRHWEETRHKFQVANPQASLKDFHDQALALGGLPLSVLDSALGVS
ncbi:MAG: DUF885 domain-containing protein [Actinomycetaceae bacterium]|nr:DUF885 domain-containing protein [Actinomycetaceae bacterium]